MTVLFKVDCLANGYPFPFMESTESFIPSANGTVISTPSGDMIVVRHSNIQTDANTYTRFIYVVPAQMYASVRSPKDGDGSVIGYYKLPFQKCISPVKRNSYVHSDKIVDSYLESLQLTHGKDNEV